MVFLRTYGSGFRQNEKKTLLKKVKCANLIEQVMNPEVKAALIKYTYHPDLNLWDFGIRASRHINPGDVVYILRCEDTLYYSQILDKIMDSQGRIGDIVGWHRIQKSPWENPVLLKNLVRLPGLSQALHTYISGMRSLEENFYKLSV